MRITSYLFLLGLGAAGAGAAGSPLLNRVVGQWLAEGNHWAFTVRVREFGDDEVKEERVERYDPSKPGPERWELVTVDGSAPTEARRLAWLKAKARRHRAAPPSLADYFDLEHASVAGVTPVAIRYLLPLRSNRNWLLPVDRVALTVTVNRTTHAIEEVQAGIAEPYHVAFGLARIIEVDFDVKMNPSRQRGAAPGPATSQPQGLAHVTITRLGERIEYTWSDFRRVTPSPDVVAAEQPAG